MSSCARRDIFACGKSDIVITLTLEKRISLGGNPNITAQQYHSL